MGIQGLLPVLKEAAVVTHIRELRNQTCAVDVYSWIHRGTYGCATDICTSSGNTEGYVSFCEGMLELLLTNGITPIMVFDGARLIAKENVEKEREIKRANGLEEGKKLLEQGKSKEALNAFCKAVDVTPEMARKVVLAFRRRNVKVIVAPFEADAQLAYLSITGKVDFIISEDSDCLPFGCQRVLFKLDKSTGIGQMMDIRKVKKIEEIYLEHFTADMFLDMCILTGCDYLDSIRGVGIKTAHSLVQKYKTTSKILRGLRFEIKETIPTDYEMKFYRARLTFKHQIIFSIEENCFTNLANSNIQCVEWPSLLNDLSFLGKFKHDLSKEMMIEWANGNVNPETYEVFPMAETTSLLQINHNGPTITKQLGMKRPQLNGNNKRTSEKTIEAFFERSTKNKSTGGVSSIIENKPQRNSITANPWVNQFTAHHHQKIVATSKGSKFFTGVVAPGALRGPPLPSSSQGFKKLFLDAGSTNENFSSTTYLSTTTTPISMHQKLEKPFAGEEEEIIEDVEVVMVNTTSKQTSSSFAHLGFQI